MTGANSGIGEAAARHLQESGHALTVVCRSRERAEQSLDWLQDPSQILIADLADLIAVKKMVDQLALDGQQFDVLVLNAGSVFLTFENVLVLLHLTKNLCTLTFDFSFELLLG